jgi:hypothetical protein
MEYDNETTKILYNLFACVSRVYASFICSHVVIMDNREISVKKGGPDKGEKLITVLKVIPIKNDPV